MDTGLKSLPEKVKQGSIFRKLLTNYIALTLLIVLLISLVSFFLVRQYTINANLEELRSKAETLAEMIGQPGGKTRYLVSQARMSELQALSDARLVFIENDMEVISQPPKFWPGSEDDLANIERLDITDDLDEELLQRLLDGESFTDVRKLDFMNDEVVFAGEPVIDVNDNQIGAVMLYRPLRQVSATTQRIAAMMLMAGSIALLFAFALAYYMGKRISRPLVRMNATAKHIAEGNFGEQVPIHENDEVGELGSTLNLLSARLSAVIQNLSEEKSKLQQILASIGEGIIAIDHQGHMVHHNRSALALLGLDDWPGADSAHGEDLQRILDMLGTSRDTGERGQARFDNPKGQSIEAISSRVLGEDGASIGAVCLLRDISEAQRLEQMRRDYIANISHELRTPLTGIRGMVEPLMDGYIETDEERMDCYRVIYQETMRLQKLIGEMLDLSRLQAGRIQIDLEPMEIKPLLAAARRRLLERAVDGEVQIPVEAAEDLAVLGSEDRILQVLIILLDNALGFTRPGGSITLGARPAGEMVEVYVRDTGAGISPEDLPYIWERFYKADKSRLKTQGVGLGLSIAKLAVELMGGTISVETELGVGTTFTFTLRAVNE